MDTVVESEVEIPADLVERAMQLSHPAKLKLAGLLVKATEAPADDPELVRKEWQAVIADRVEGYLSGRYKTEDAKEMIDRVRRKLLEKFPQ